MDWRRLDDGILRLLQGNVMQRTSSLPHPLPDPFTQTFTCTVCTCKHGAHRLVWRAPLHAGWQMSCVAARWPPLVWDVAWTDTSCCTSLTHQRVGAGAVVACMYVFSGAKEGWIVPLGHMYDTCCTTDSSQSMMSHHHLHTPHMRPTCDAVVQVTQRLVTWTCTHGMMRLGDCGARPCTPPLKVVGTCSTCVGSATSYHTSVDCALPRASHVYHTFVPTSLARGAQQRDRHPLAATSRAQLACKACAEWGRSGSC
jgi:hypothetical protein